MTILGIILKLRGILIYLVQDRKDRLNVFMMITNTSGSTKVVFNVSFQFWIWTPLYAIIPAVKCCNLSSK
jgi:hypothetical protein